MAFIKLDKLRFLLSTFKRIEFFIKNTQKSLENQWFYDFSISLQKSVSFLHLMKKNFLQKMCQKALQNKDF